MGALLLFSYVARLIFNIAEFHNVITIKKRKEEKRGQNSCDNGHVETLQDHVNEYETLTWMILLHVALTERTSY